MNRCFSFIYVIHSFLLALSYSKDGNSNLLTLSFIWTLSTGSGSDDTKPRWSTKNRHGPAKNRHG